MEWSLEAYRYMWTRVEYIGHSFLISCLITVVGTVLSLGLIGTMAFTLSRRDFKLRNTQGRFSVLTGACYLC
jgi:putative aldouronate transport system permease protein